MIRVIFIALLLAPLGCRGPKAGYEPSSSGPYVSVMTYNVENLFDTEHDAGKNDYAYLPKAKKDGEVRRECNKIRRESWRRVCLELDWSEEVLNLKMGRLRDVLAQVGGGKGPDILILQEVENIRVLERWRSAFLDSFGYGPAVLLEGDDIRGIDVALLTRLEVAEKPRLRKIPFKGMTKSQLRDSRAILQTALRLPDGNLLHVFGGHFPAPFHPRKFREQAFDYLRVLLDELPEGSMAVAAGDFNLPSKEDAQYNVLDNHVASRWYAAHRIGCEACRGTYYYPPEDTWSFLDMILVSKNLFSESGAAWTALPKSVFVANGAPHQKKPDGAPRRFDASERTGVSDHWPLVLRLGRRQ